MLDLTFNTDGYHTFPKDTEALSHVERSLAEIGYEVEPPSENELLKMSRGNKFACLYAVDIKKYKTEIIVSDGGDDYRIYWRLYYNILSFIGWRDLKVIEEETKKIFDAFGFEKPLSAIFDKKTRLVFRLNPVYVVLTFILLAFLVLDGYFLIRNNMHIFRPKPVWYTLDDGRALAKENDGILLVLYYKKSDPWTKYDMGNIFSGKELTEYITDNSVYPVKIEANITGILPGGLSPFLEIYDSKMKLRARTNLLGKSDDVLHMLRILD